MLLQVVVILLNMLSLTVGDCSSHLIDYQQQEPSKGMHVICAYASEKTPGVMVVKGLEHAYTEFFMSHHGDSGDILPLLNGLYDILGNNLSPSLSQCITDFKFPPCFTSLHHSLLHNLPCMYVCMYVCIHVCVHKYACRYLQQPPCKEVGHIHRPRHSYIQPRLAALSPDGHHTHQWTMDLARSTGWSPANNFRGDQPNHSLSSSIGAPCT